MANFDDVILAAKSLSRGNVEVKLIDDAYPTFLYRMAKLKNSDLISGGSESTHAAWVVDDVEYNEFLFSCYINQVIGEKALSLPFSAPKHTVTFDQAKAYCEANGAGYHLATIAEYAAIALWTRINSCMPHGNNNYGKDVTYPYETATEVSSSGSPIKTNRTATGSGPVSWNHSNLPYGIADLNGNVYEWQGGYRTVNGEIQLLPNNNAAVTGRNQLANSTLWKAILQDGSLVAPGTENTLKWDYISAAPASGSAVFQLNTALDNPPADAAPSGAITFETLAAKAGVAIPDLLKQLTIMPVDSGSHNLDYFYMKNFGECLGFRGGAWSSASSTGVFGVFGNSPRSVAFISLGVRSAFITGA